MELSGENKALASQRPAQTSACGFVALSKAGTMHPVSSSDLEEKKREVWNEGRYDAWVPAFDSAALVESSARPTTAQTTNKLA